MGQALYRKYRPTTLTEIVGQDHVTTTLSNALKQGKISHAYLLSGPRGVGKTSIARILAHEINSLPYTDEAVLDIIEIDAASNRRIDEIRDLRDKVHAAPSQAKFKVYIIDEVHMLTREAFNALLKTLEEPPAHVVFILATTEAHKLPETIISRTQRHTLRPAPAEQVVHLLQTIAKKEKLTIDNDALQLIAENGGGSFRDSVSLLDQASSVSDHVTRKHIEQTLGLVPAEHIAKLAAAIQAQDASTVVTVLADFYNQGYEPPMIARQLSVDIRAQIISGQAANPGECLTLLERLLDVAAARNPKQLLEIILLQQCTVSMVQAAPVTTPATLLEKPVHVSSPPQAAPSPEKPQPVPTPKAAKQEETQAPILVQPPSEPIEDVVALWQQTLDEIKKQYNTLYGIARMATPNIEDGKLVLRFKFAFHQKRINEAKNRKIFATVVEQLYGSPLEITCIVAEPTEEAKKTDVSTISNIFGGAELLES